MQAVRHDGTLLLDPTLADEEVSGAHCTFVYRTSGGAGAAAAYGGADSNATPPADVQPYALISSVHGGCGLTGQMSEESYWAALAAGRAAAEKVEGFVRRHTAHHYSRGAVKC